MRMQSGGGFLVRPESGHVNRLRMLTKVTESQSRGAFFIFERVLHPGDQVPLHVHAGEDGCTYLVSGELSYVVGGQSFVATAGSYVLKPRDTEHAWRNEAATAACVIEIAVPGGIEGYFRELDALSGHADVASSAYRAAVATLSVRYGIRWA